MSRQGAPGSQSGSNHDSSFQRPYQNAPPSTGRMQVHSLSRDPTPDSQGGNSVSLPPLRQFSRTPPTPSSDGRRSLGMQSILNPQSELLEQRGRRRSAAQMESPSPIESTPANSLPSLSRPTSVDSTQEDLASGRGYPGTVRSVRNILSPRSPALHRTQSLGVLNPPTGTIDAHHTPFLSPGTRTYMVQPGTSQAPPLPTPPAALRAEYNFPPPAPTPPLQRPDLRRRSMGFPQSGSASPTTSFSPFTQPASLSGHQYEQNGPAPSSYIRMRSDTPSSQHYPNQSLSVEPERNYIPVASTGQSSYQILTVNTQEGHSIQIPVDVQAASKSADEKRKRNAGASARFRQRRKEKEKEASHTISKLEQQLREANEDLEHYKAERDYFRNVIGQQPGAGIHFPRPTSPRIGRTPIPSSGPPSSTTDSPNRYSEFSEPPEHREVGRNVRRRTSNYAPAPAPAPVPQSGPGSQHQPYTSTAFPPIVPNPASQPRNHTQSGHVLHQQQQQPPQHQQQQQQQQHESRPLRQQVESTQPQQHPQRPVQRDSFNQEARYDRSWPPPMSGRDTRRQ